MRIVMIADFKKENGDIDWAAYNKAQVEAGEKCLKCGAFMLKLNLFGRETAGPRICHQCNEGANTLEEIEHDKMVRCPECRHMFDAWDQPFYDGMSPGSEEAEMDCPACDCSFTIEVITTYSFKSPPMKKEGSVGS